jgi:hypothetical protein
MRINEKCFLILLAICRIREKCVLKTDAYSICGIMAMKTFVTNGIATRNQQKTDTSSGTLKEAMRKTVVVGAALAATAGLAGCVPFPGQIGMVGRYVGSEVTYGEGNPYYMYQEETPYYNYNYGGILPYYNYMNTPDYEYSVPGYTYGGGILNYSYIGRPDYDYGRGYGDMQGQEFGDRDGGDMWHERRR